MNISIIYEDEDLLAIDKPSGITVNRSDTTRGEETVQDWINKNFQFPNYNFQVKKGEYETPEEAFIKRSGIVHRLDKETSGILLIAKTLHAFIDLQRQFKERIIKKSYIAITHGKILPQEGEISVPVGRLEFNRKRFGVVAGGRESITIYRVISNFQFSISKNNSEVLSLVELYPQTGRTHQIRVHLKHLNHPIFSDELYAGRKVARQDRKFLPRLFLHAEKISFIHPTSRKEINLESSLPKDLAQFLGTLNKL